MILNRVNVIDSFECAGNYDGIFFNIKSYIFGIGMFYLFFFHLFLLVGG